MADPRVSVEIAVDTTGWRCSGRCWFAYYGWVGSSAPTCRRCGRDNPNYRPQDDPFRRTPRERGTA